MSEAKPSLNDLRIDRKHAPKSDSRVLSALAALVLVALLAVLAVWWFKRAPALELHTVVAHEASAAGPDERTVLNASGYVTARREATVSSKVTGKVMEVLIEEGMKVHEGQVLARIDDTNVKASLKLAEAQLASSKAALEETRVRKREADQEFERQAGLLTNNIAAKSDYDHAEAAALAYKAKLAQQETDVTVAERTVSTWEQQLEDTIIRAPFDGIVTSKNAQPGEMISPISAGGGFTRTGICTIVDMDSLEIEVDVSESYINRVQATQPVEATLDAYPDWKIPCKVIAIIPTADRQKSTVKVRVGFDKLDPRILPEMSVKVGFREPVHSSSAATHGVSIPKSALQQQDGHDIVLVVANGRAERRAITVSNSSTENAVIGSGLSAGEKVALDWPPDVRDGARVKEVGQ